MKTSHMCINQNWLWRDGAQFHVYYQQLTKNTRRYGAHENKQSKFPRHLLLHLLTLTP